MEFSDLFKRRRMVHHFEPRRLRGDVLDDPDRTPPAAGFAAHLPGRRGGRS